MLSKQKVDVALKSLSDILQRQARTFPPKPFRKACRLQWPFGDRGRPTWSCMSADFQKVWPRNCSNHLSSGNWFERGIVKNCKNLPKKLVDRKRPVIWISFENILKGHPVLLNRAPTLHRLSIQAFQPQLVEGKKLSSCTRSFVQRSTLTSTVTRCGCTFHWDSCYSWSAVMMLASHNMLNPQDGSRSPCLHRTWYWDSITWQRKEGQLMAQKVQGEGKTFIVAEEVVIAHNEGKLDLHAIINVRISVERWNRENRVNEDYWNDYRKSTLQWSCAKFSSLYQYLVGRRKIFVKSSVDILIRRTSPGTAQFLDDIKGLGFSWAFRAGFVI